MWRQMRIHNSFTLEATFSGTAMQRNCERDECRHFNIADYMDMGQTLCQSVLEYHLTQENKARQTEIALEMTRYLTCQVLNRRNQGINYKMPNLRAFMRTEKPVNEPEDIVEANKERQTEYNNRGHIEISDKFTGDLVTRIESALNSQDDKLKKLKDKKLDSKNLSKVQVDQILDSANIKTMDGCLKILAELHVSEALEESDSSDSDSESEPELKPPSEPKIKKKKRKSKKQRDKEQQERKTGSGGTEKKEERKLSVSCMVLSSFNSIFNSNILFCFFFLLLSFYFKLRQVNTHFHSQLEIKKWMANYCNSRRLKCIKNI